uniref:Ig-like domain-containing protein n=1 Tax=Xiphophorus maculatus TaxID=8083 RepID=A0A3B5QFX7_XIPMA
MKPLLNDHSGPKYSQLVQPGQSLTITCRPSGYSVTDSYATGWIRHREGKPMEWIFHMWGSGTFYKNDALKNKFSYSRDTSAGTVTITGQNLQPEDTAVYYCVRHTVIQTTFKTAQKLSSQQSDMDFIKTKAH